LTRDDRAQEEQTMSATGGFLSQIRDGLIYGFTFAIGWVAAMLLVGVVIA